MRRKDMEVDSMFSIEALVERSRKALRDPDPCDSIRTILADVLAEPSSVVSAFEAAGVPQGPDAPLAIQTLFEDEDLRIQRIAGPKGLVSAPHSHGRWAVIGVYSGQENNRIWERRGDSIVLTEGYDLVHPEILMLPERTSIHSIANPGPGTSHAIHVYSGIEPDKGWMWHPRTLEEKPFEVDVFYKWCLEAPQDYIDQHMRPAA
jgi:predicted metal-dependent enzyme (double-stranded beta helix superfamily)